MCLTATNCCDAKAQKEMFTFSENGDFILGKDSNLFSLSC